MIDTQQGHAEFADAGVPHNDLVDDEMAITIWSYLIKTQAAGDELAAFFVCKIELINGETRRFLPIYYTQGVT